MAILNFGNGRISDLSGVKSVGATYGSVATVVVFLIWLSWSVNAVFFGGAFATEIEIVLRERERRLLPDD